MGDNISRGEEAYQQLKHAIRNGTLAPGTRVREIEIADRFGFSRTPPARRSGGSRRRG